ncbi:hypothetical protein GCM10010401_16910 [Rarobacter faecitabidus]
MKWRSIKKKPVILGSELYENETLESATRTESISIDKTIAASVDVSYEGGLEAGFALAKLSAKTRYSLKAEGKKTKSRSVSVTHKLRPKSRTVFYYGTTKVSGSFDYYYPACEKSRFEENSRLVWKRNRGAVMSFTVETKGAVDCRVKPSRRSLAFFARKAC